jgi:AcrR family transcriptional regulator
MIASTPYRDLKVTDITRGAGTSPATFYQYFVDIEAVILALAERAADEGSHLADLIPDRSWRGSVGRRAAETIVDAFLEFWAANQHILRVVDLLTAEGDDRFRKVRFGMLNAVTRALAKVIADQGPEPEVDPMATAGSLVAMLAQVSSHQHGFEAASIPVREAREAMVRLVYWGVTSPRVPKG